MFIFYKLGQSSIIAMFIYDIWLAELSNKYIKK